MICLLCGARNPDDAKTCFKCGAGLQAPQTPKTPITKKFTEVSPKPTMPSRSVANTLSTRPSAPTFKAAPPRGLPTSRIPSPTMPKSPVYKTSAQPVKSEPPISSTTPESEYVAPPKKGGKILKIVAVILIIGVLVAGGVFAYNTWLKNTDFGKTISNLNPFKKKTEQTKETITPEEQPKSEPKKEETIIEPKKETTKKDSDYDGLTDEQEKKYKTDPNDADTDGDGYPDGQEVKNGYNPNGTGKLKSSKTNTSTTKEGWTKVKGAKTKAK